ncbi:histidine--tRNA ligase [Comamonas koreensis]|uniref:histidine--tRNA ligase n=1 Tax=Comamonas koreensis TaxID=160825 RepID=UPI0015FB93B0|nr:histidine--tRNA ligase [Comamonas koreensis]
MGMNEKLAAIKGMNDILPPDSAMWEWFEGKVRDVMGRFAYRNIRTPLAEHTALFVRGLGEVTDIVEKEMYSFEDRADKHGQAEHLTLRPEGTAGVVRAVVENNLLYDGGKRLFYIGAMFRREKPQRGRYRQFHQVGVEAMGFGGAELDAEVILLAAQLWKDLGIEGVRLELNSLGQPEERRAHREALVAYFEQHTEVMDDEGKRRMYSNPLRVLDTKNPAMQAMVNAAPQLLDFLGEDSKAHLKAVQDILDANGVAWSVNPRLVRGMDYYNLTVFEFITDKLGSQGTICGGGRYDYLIEQIGGKPAPAVGWGMGIERVLELIKELNIQWDRPSIDAYAILPDAALLPQAMRVIQTLRQAGVRVQMHGSAVAGSLGSMKSQFKKADASGAACALIFGSDEMQRGMVTVKQLRDGEGAQAERAIDAVAGWAAQLRA